MWQNAGKVNVAAAVIQRQYPKATYVHSASHRLNFCIAKANDRTAERLMFDTVTSIANFF